MERAEQESKKVRELTVEELQKIAGGLARPRGPLSETLVGNA
jgi:hypothetical protein